MTALTANRPCALPGLVLLFLAALLAPAGAQEDAAARYRAQRVDLLRQALNAAQEAGLDILQQRITDQLAEASLRAGDLDAARAAYTDIVNRSEERRQQLAFDPQLRQQWFADNIGPYRKLLRIVALQQDPAMALSVAERMRSRALQDQLAWQKVDMGLRLSPEDQQRLAQLRGLREQAYGQLQWALGGSKPQSDEADVTEDKRGAYMPIRGRYMPIRGPLDNSPAATSEDIAALKVMLSRLAQEETALESAIRESVPAYAQACEITIPTGEELAAEVARHQDLGVLEYTLCDDGVAVVAMGPGGPPRVEHIALNADDLWEQIGKLREAIWERKPEALQIGAGLYSTLVSPVAQTLAGARRLWVIADSALQLVPFSALVCSDGVFLGYYAAVATAPSLSLALDSRGTRQAPAGTALILAAPDTGAPPSDPATESDRGKYLPIRGMYMPVRGSYLPVRGDGGVSSALTAMAMVPLPGARAEGETLAAGIPGARLLTGKAATKEQLLALGGDCDILHIATHGYADPDYPDFSGVLLAGAGPETPYDTLTAREVYTWPLKARLVTLSACQTALGKDMEGEGVLGLTRAFIFAGAQDVLCSLWPVADASTRALMTDLYAALARGKSVEEALHAAQISLMSKAETNAPFYWAAFQAVRGPQ